MKTLDTHHEGQSSVDESTSGAKGQHTDAERTP